MKKRILSGLIALGLMLMSGLGWAQNYSSARSVSMAGAYTALAQGAMAPAYNPANLALPDRPGFSMQFVGVGVNIGNATFSKSMYEKYNGQYLSEEDISDILSKVPEDGFKLFANSDLQVLGFSIGRFALTFNGCLQSGIAVSKDYLRILLQGFQVDKDYDIGENSGEAIGYSSVSGSFAFPLRLPIFGRFYVGTNMSYLVGLAYAEVLDSYGQVHFGRYDVDGEGFVRARYAQGGAGFAVDLGIAKTFKGWYFGAMLKNFVSSIKWTSEPEEFEARVYTEYAVNVENTADKDSTEEFLKSEDETREIDAFSTSLPSRLRFGVARKWRSFVFAVDWHQPLSQQAARNRKPYIAFGSEWNGLKILPLRLGIGLGGDLGSTLALGAGLKLGFFRIDAGVNFVGALSPGHANSMGVAANTYLQF